MCCIRVKVFLCLFFFCFFIDSSLAGNGPIEDLKPTLNGIMGVITDPAFQAAEKKDERRKRVMVIAESGFDFEAMARLALGKTWKKIDTGQRQYFVELFMKLMENAYVGKLESYTGQVTKYIGERIKGKKAEVKTIMKNNGVSLPVNYIMVKKTDVWKVYDINIEGVRLLRNYREQFKSILRKKKFDGLLKVLEEKNATFVQSS